MTKAKKSRNQKKVKSFQNSYFKQRFKDYSHLENYEQSHQLEIDGIKLSEERKHAEAIAKFDQAIAVCPKNPSAYNNRAQQRQLLKQLEGKSFFAQGD